MSDYKGAALMLPAMPKGAPRRQGLRRRLVPRPPRQAPHRRLHSFEIQPQTAIPYDAVLYKQRHKIENMSGRLKDWRRFHTRYDRCAHTYFSAICIAAAVVFWLRSMSPEPSFAKVTFLLTPNERMVSPEYWRPLALQGPAVPIGNFVANYKQTILGPAWFIMRPLICLHGYIWKRRKNSGRLSPACPFLHDRIVGIGCSKACPVRFSPTPACLVNSGISGQS